jgi:hypothetical protein
MSNTLTISQAYSLNGRTYQNAATVTADGLVSKIVTAAAAKIGQLTTRTDNNTGTLTMDSGHGITTGARLDLYWDGGSQRGITVGTVSVDSVPFDLGVGDNLPANLTAITAAVPTEESFPITGDDMQALLFYGDQRVIVVLAGDDDAEDFGMEVGSTSNTGRSFLWYADDPNAPTNPIASDTVTKAFISCGSSSSSAEVRVEALFS